MPLSHTYIEQIHAAGNQFVLAIAGGGSGAISSLLSVPGASRSVLEATVPYSSAALCQWLTTVPEQACSSATACNMAVTAWMRARSLGDPGDIQLRGLGATASLVSQRPKRGEHRIHVAWQSATKHYSLQLSKGLRDRTAEELLAADLILLALLDACNIDAAAARAEFASRLQPEEVVHERRITAPRAWSELLLGERDVVTWSIGDQVPLESSGASPTNEPCVAGPAVPPVVFPGAFDPPHAGHWKMMEVAERLLGHPVAVELSVINVDKPTLDYLAVEARVDSLRRDRVAACAETMLLTRAPTFVDKSRLVPGTTFVVGADTIARLAHPKYHDDDVAARDQAIARIADLENRFLVFGRKSAGSFATLSDLNLPLPLRQLCDAVSEADFRSDLSSTVLRRRTPAD